MKSTRIATFLCAAALCLPALPLAASGSESLPAPDAPALSPEQVAVNEYNEGIELRDKAREADEKAAATSDEGKRAKLETRRSELFEKAVTHYQTAIANKPDFYQAYGSLGYALRRLARYDEAMKAYDEALRLDPNYSEAIEYRAEALLGLHRVDEAQEAYERLAIVSPGHAAQLLAAFKAWIPASGLQDDAALAEWLTQRESVSDATSPGVSSDPGTWP
jgi:tetratricopeptide (TPR) repeat protein